MRHDESQRGLLQHVHGPPCNEQVLCRDAAVGLLPNRECAHAEVADSARQFRAGLDRHRLAVLGETDAPREEWPAVGVDVAELENTGILQEEVALLRKEQ